MSMRGLVIFVTLVAPIAARAEGARARNVILVIGDGMGLAQVNLLDLYRELVDGRPSQIARLIAGGSAGMVRTEAYQVLGTDSAAAATAIACGKLTRPDIIGKGPDGEDLPSLLDRARRDHGMALGVVTNTRVSDATPASFTAHALTRKSEQEIILEQFALAPEVLMGGGRKYWLPPGYRTSSGEEGNRPDGRNMVVEAQKAGYQTLLSGTALRSAVADERKILGLFYDSHLPYRIDADERSRFDCPSLTEMVKIALERLKRHPAGFFLLVEAGRIDHACHSNDPASLLQEMLELDETLEVLIDHAREDGQTAVFLTADHETGGFAFSPGIRDIPAPITLSSGESYQPGHGYGNAAVLKDLARLTGSFENLVRRSKGDPAALQQMVAERLSTPITSLQASSILTGTPVDCDLAIPDHERPHYPYAFLAPNAALSRLVRGRFGVVFSTGTHTSLPVLLAGMGPGSERAAGMHRIHEVFDIVLAAMSPTGTTGTPTPTAR